MFCQFHASFSGHQDFPVLEWARSLEAILKEEVLYLLAAVNKLAIALQLIEFCKISTVLQFVFLS